MLWLFLPFVVILSGVVAYAADTIAKKAGRKHLRWFGLRPKTTALIVAVLSGMGISAASLAAFLVLNSSAINTIAQADQLRPQLDALKTEILGVQNDLKTAQSGRDTAQREADALREQQQAALTDLQAARSNLKDARTAQQRLQTEAAALQDKVEALTTLRTDLEARAALSRTLLTASEAAFASSQARAEALDSQVVDLNTRSALAEQEAQLAQNRAATAQIQTEEAQQQAEQAQAQADAAQVQATAAQAQAKAAQGQARVARAQVLAVAAQVQQAQAQVRQAQARVQQAGAQAKAAQAKAQQAQAQVEQTRSLAAQLGGQVRQLEADRAAATKERDAAVTARTQAETQRDATQRESARLIGERDRIANERDRVAQERNRAAAELTKAAQERQQATAERDRVRAEVTTLRTQQKQLLTANEVLSKDLATARATLGQLQDEYSSARTELSASRNTDLAFPRNDLVYAGVVPGVRNLDAFLQAAATAAQSRGAKGTPAARLNAAARTALETKLRGLNASTFVQCRAASNTVTGFPVDLTCDARPNSVLYRSGEGIRRVNLTLSADTRTLQAQISEAVQDVVLDLTTRGVPSEYINNLGLDVNEFVDLITRLNAKTGPTATLTIAARDDVRPGSRVDLYAIVP
ncbi:DUF3084 domain-containing protein [Deinococcus sp. QL22]|uniref:DUF3084 domain-containing protein n=1 Tax=Deinococcus sp. QL22 TaxID=2939437 RepID=UPI0020175079|nr:DUF3084 domain-containing protein [Deinococcus sp. QL22]UQN06945.1 DUF3084 domain-containing protein [Deinococcus sp. QL22]